MQTHIEKGLLTHPPPPPISFNNTGHMGGSLGSSRRVCLFERVLFLRCELVCAYVHARMCAYVQMFVCVIQK